MSDREKILSAAVAAMVALWGLSQGWGKYQAALSKNLRQQQTIAQELSEARTATARGRRAQQKLRQWQRQSLPTDADIAKSLYQDWLQQQLTAAGLKVKELSTRSPRSGSASYQQFSFVVSATGTLEQFTNFLYEFYQAKHLHRISHTELLPSEDRKSLKTISLTIDALSLAEGSRKDQLAKGSSEAIGQPLEKLRDSIVGRNLFATYEPPQEKNSTESADSDAAQAKFSGFNYGEGGWQMTVRMEKSGKVYYFREGDKIKIGSFRGTLKKLDGDRRRAVISTSSGSVQFQLGQTLAEAQPLSEQAS